MKRQVIRLNPWLLPVALLAILAGGGVWYLQQPAPVGTPDMSNAFNEPAGKTPETPPPGSPVERGKREPEHQTPDSLGKQPFARSLAGTDIDGALRADSSGQLIVDLGVRDFFDYFLSAVGEVSPEAAISQIQTMAREYLPEPAATEALALLDQYLAYKQNALHLMQTELDPARQQDPGYQLTALGEALRELKQLRRSTFSPQAHDAFFGQEEAYSEYTLAAMAVQQRTDLSDDGKQALVEWHRSQLPESLRATEQRLHSSSRQHQARVAALASTESPEAAGEKLKELGLSEDSAEGVVDYLEQRQSFARQFEAFEQATGDDGLEGLADTEKQKHRDALLKEYFPDEQSRTWARLRMLDKS